MSGIIQMEPFDHDCSDCVWCGWVTLDRPYNAYLCGAKREFPTVILRYGNEPHQYKTFGPGVVKGDCGIASEVAGHIDMTTARIKGAS